MTTTVLLAISEVMSASALVEAAETQALTHVRAANLSDVFVSGLQCKQRNDAENSSLASDGVESSDCCAQGIISTPHLKPP